MGLIYVKRICLLLSVLNLRIHIGTFLIKWVSSSHVLNSGLKTTWSSYCLNKLITLSSKIPCFSYSIDVPGKVIHLQISIKSIKKTWFIDWSQNEIKILDLKNRVRKKMILGQIVYRLDHYFLIRNCLEDCFILLIWWRTRLDDGK